MEELEKKSLFCVHCGNEIALACYNSDVMPETCPVCFQDPLFANLLEKGDWEDDLINMELGESGA